MQHHSTSLTPKELLDVARKKGMSDVDICNKAERLGKPINRTTLWRIRNDKLKTSSYMSTLLKLVEVICVK